MPVEIFMPALSPTMESGTLAKWLVKEGDSVSSGDVIAEIETDKATMEVESIDDGTVGKILISEGSEEVPVGDLIALLLEEGEDASALADAGKKAPAPAPEPASASTPEPAPAAATPATAPAKAEAAPAAPQANGNRVFASPLARRMAAQKGLDLSQLKGSGPHGRIVKADIESAQPGATSAPTAAMPATAPAPQGDFTPPADIPYEEVKLSSMRKVIAKRMTESKQQVPHFYLTIDCELDQLLAQRKKLNEALVDSGVKLSVNDFIIKACALGLKRVPAANAMFAGDKMYRFSRQDISVAVAIEGGLVTPVIRDAGNKGLSDISAEMKALAAKARDGKLLPEDYQGGTFSLSNLGMFGIREFGAVINPPQGAILAVGAGEQRPIVRDGAVTVATMMNCTLAVDHRALDGAIGAEFLAAFKKFIEDPVMMLV